MGVSNRKEEVTQQDGGVSANAIRHGAESDSIKYHSLNGLFHNKPIKNFMFMLYVLAPKNSIVYHLILAIFAYSAYTPSECSAWH